MGETPYREFLGRLIGYSRRMAAIVDGTVDVDSLQVHDRIVAYQDAHPGVDYTAAFDAVLNQEY